MTDDTVRILLVDDERNVLRSLERLFLEEEYEIHNAASAADGLEILEHNGPFRLIISDYRMPGKNGVEFLKEVFSRWPDTERMILSGYADLSAIVDAINQGQIFKFIAKPWNDDDLLGTVREALERYELRMRNRQLVAELLTANEELQRINDHLNTLVDERLRQALVSSRALQSFQNVVDALPIGFIGADGYGMIVQCNTLGAEMLEIDRDELIGSDLHSLLPSHILYEIVQLSGNSCGKCRLDLAGGRYVAYLTRICDEEQKAIVVALVRE